MPHWVEVADAHDCPPGSCIEVVVGDAIVVIANVDGEFHAMDGICAHQGGPLAAGRLEGCTLTCPWHGWQYDVRSGRQLLSNSIRQTVYRARESLGTIQVEVPDP
ncbi:Rieske (2Fe-2S) protein [Aeoliella sp. SH292]|uniref:Rieske (2Fe-2S) protein n=1 Tax=Aeoliella sp. SH292 TaxID=3454464 RepID=UPI003F94BF47